MIRSGTFAESLDISDKISYSPSRDVRSVVFEDNGEVMCAAVYDHWTVYAVQMHVWSGNPKYLFNPEFLRAAFSYPFVFANKGIAFAVTPGDNTASLAVSRSLGFGEVSRIKDGWDLGTDMVIQELRRENCRFLEAQPKAA